MRQRTRDEVMHDFSRSAQADSINLLFANDNRTVALVLSQEDSLKPCLHMEMDQDEAQAIVSVLSQWLQGHGHKPNAGPAPALPLIMRTQGSA